MVADATVCRVVLALAFAVALGASERAFAEELPVVRGSSTTVDVEDGGRLLRGIWTISPETELVV
jgi:hypothetical protein